jgi:hypothetical protein
VGSVAGAAAVKNTLIPHRNAKPAALNFDGFAHVKFTRKKNIF